MNSCKGRVLKNIISSILVVLIFFSLLITLINVTFNLLYSKTQVRGFSMQPTLNSNVNNPNAEGDTIYINKHASLKSNDIVVAKVDWYENYIIKRVVGVPGDKIEIKDEDTHFGLYVNDKLLYTKEKNGDANSLPRTGTVGYYENYKDFLKNEEFKNIIVHEYNNSYIQLGEHDYFLMGDNWGHTTDSIEKGPIKKSDIIGKVELVIDVTNNNPFEPTIFFLKKLFS